VKDYATIAEPLIYVTKKGISFYWDLSQDSAFQELKAKLISYPVLRHFDRIKPVEIHTACSGVRCSAVLIQKYDEDEYAVAYSSKKLNKAQRNYGATA
jgi:RNase H-like domain found in reverse transcriptase